MTTEQLIAEGALKRAKDIVDNKDFWSGPGPAKTSGEAVGILLEVAKSAGRPRPAPAEVIPPVPAKNAPKPQPAPKADGEPAATPANVQ